MTHGQVEVGGQPKGLCLLCVLVRETGLVLQPGYNLLVLQHSLLILAFLEREGGSGTRLSSPAPPQDQPAPIHAVKTAGAPCPLPGRVLRALDAGSP